MARRRPLLVLVFVPSLLLLACAARPIDPAQAVSTLDGPQVDAFCKETGRALSDDDLRRVLCSVEAQAALSYAAADPATGSTRLDACQKTLDACLAAKRDVSKARGGCQLREHASLCTAKVAELRACLQEIAAETRRSAESFTCERAATTTPLTPVPRTCAAIAETCPLVGLPSAADSKPVKATRVE